MKKYFFSRYLILIIALSFLYSCATYPSNPWKDDPPECTNWRGEIKNPGNFSGAGKCSAAGGMLGVPDD